MNPTKQILYEDLGALNRPFEAEFRQKFNAFLASGWYVLGNEVTSFEHAFSAYCNAKYCSGVASGLDALTIALQVFRFKKGGEVIVPSNTYIATILAIVNNGLVPVLVEPDMVTYNITPEGVESAISSKTVVVMPVHLYGKCCNMSGIMDVAKAHHLKVIEDAAQAHGARYDHQVAGSFGDFGAFSFYPTKNLGALGDGGALITNDPELDAAAKMIRNYGSKKKYYNEVAGINSRLDELQAAFLNVKLQYLDRINQHKRRLAQIYFDHLPDDFTLPLVQPEAFDVFHIFNIRTHRRDELRAYLLENGIRTEIHYPVPPHQQKAMKSVLSGRYPVAEEIHQTTLSLPVSFAHSESDIEYIVDRLNLFVK